MILDADGGDAVTVTNSRLDVNAHLATTPSIDIGDVQILAGTASIGTVGLNAGTNLIGKVINAITGITSGVNNAVGTSAEVLAGSAACVKVDMMAAPANTGYIWVGSSGVAADGSGGGVRLGPGDFYSMEIDNITKIYVIATVNAEDIMYSYYTTS